MHNQDLKLVDPNDLALPLQLDVYVPLPVSSKNAHSQNWIPRVPIFTEIYLPWYLFSQKYEHVGVHIYNKYRHPLVKIHPLALLFS